MSNKEYYEHGTSAHISTDEMVRRGALRFTVRGESATGAATDYVVIPQDCRLVAYYVAISGDPGADACVAAVKSKDASTTYGSRTFATGSAAGDSDSIDLTPVFVSAGTVLALTKDATTNAVRLYHTVVAETLSA